MLIERAVKNIGYTNNNGTLGTVKVNVIATAKFNAQLIVSIVSLNGLLFQSCRIKLTVLCQFVFN